MLFRALSFARDGSDAGGVAVLCVLAGALLLLGARAGGAVQGLLELVSRC